MAIEKSSETSTHDGATAGHWMHETDAHRESFERGRQAGFREGIEAAIDLVTRLGVGGAVVAMLNGLLAAAPSDTEN